MNIAKIDNKKPQESHKKTQEDKQITNLALQERPNYHDHHPRQVQGGG